MHKQLVFVPGSAYAEGGVRAVPQLQRDLPRRRTPHHTHLRLRRMGSLPLRHEGQTRYSTTFRHPDGKHDDQKSINYLECLDIQFTPQKLNRE